MLRTYLFNPPASLVLFLLFYVSGAIAKRLGKSGHGVGRVFSGWLLKANGIRAEVEGADRLRGQGACVLVSNHLSLADTPLLYAYLPLEFRFIAKASLFRAPIVGAHLSRSGHISVMREDPRSAVKSLAQAAEVLARGVSVLLFAEGSRSDGLLQSFKGGAAHLAIKSGVPVVPIAVEGTAEVLPKGSFLMRPGLVRLRVGKPLPTEGLGPKDRDQFTRNLQASVASLLHES